MIGRSINHETVPAICRSKCGFLLWKILVRSDTNYFLNRWHILNKQSLLIPSIRFLQSQNLIIYQIFQLMPRVLVVLLDAWLLHQILQDSFSALFLILSLHQLLLTMTVMYLGVILNWPSSPGQFFRRSPKPVLAALVKLGTFAGDAKFFIHLEINKLSHILQFDETTFL